MQLIELATLSLSPTKTKKLTIPLIAIWRAAIHPSSHVLKANCIQTTHAIHPSSHVIHFTSCKLLHSHHVNDLQKIALAAAENVQVNLFEVNNLRSLFFCQQIIGPGALNEVRVGGGVRV